METLSLSKIQISSIDQFRTQLISVYRIYKRDKVMPKERREYCIGYHDALLNLGVLTEQQMAQIIDEVNEEIFGMTLAQRQYELDFFHEPLLAESASSKG
ncbi:MAG: hypothetical protein QGI54_03020 [Gammaproteobacteria bacterium]|nr:hypothetical protein [Gammaproteobacteria bacterium]